MLKIIDFLENEYWTDWVVRLHDFSTVFFSIYRGILELKNNTNILCKNGSFANKTCCALTELFVKTNICFCRYNFRKINK